MNEIAEIPLLSEEEEKTASPEELAYHNLRLVFSIANSYKNVSSLPLEDLFQEGVIGLCLASQRYDGSGRFSTFAYPYIKKYILQALNRNHTQYVPLGIGEQSTKIKLAVARLSANLGHEPDVSQISEETAIPPDRIRQVLEATQSAFSLDAPISSEDEDTSLGDLTPSSALDPYQYLAQEDDKRTLREILSTLTAKEEEALTIRFGLNSTKGATLEEVGERIGVGKERARQITNNAIRKLRNPARLKLLQDLL